jgi:hypothetical protein
MIEPFVRRYRKGEIPKDIVFWRTQSLEARLQAVEEIRCEYHGWSFDTQPRLQRILRRIKRGETSG